MALHKTQCPHCFTSYVISDAQLRVSEGMVRCGTCRERFQARLINDVETPRFDPREAFIEPLSDESETSISEIIADVEEELKPEDIEFVDPHTESQPESKPQHENEQENTLSINPSITVEANSESDEQEPVSNNNPDKLSANEMLANIEAKQQREAGRLEDLTQEELAQQQELALNTPTFTSSFATDNELSSENQAELGESEELINQVDSLVDDKLISNNAITNVQETEHPSENQVSLDQPPANQAPFDLAPKVKKKGRAWLYVPPLSILIVLLGALLSYQLWMKQIVNFKESSFAHSKFVEVTAPLAKELEKHDIALPVRRNLSQMELLAARTEPHPTRSSTILLRVSIVNRADISQPLPWLEMSLTDADGRLVSRRNLSPNDYLYNNNSLNQIGPNELKKITIELLSFPKQATGYELKLLNR